MYTGTSIEKHSILYWFRNAIKLQYLRSYLNMYWTLLQAPL